MADSTSDLKLLPGQVRAEAWDLCLDASDRRGDDTGQRRALVHDFDDGLTVNWDGDYPGGVTIKGTKVRVAGKLEVTAFFAPQASGAPGRATPAGTSVSLEASRAALATRGSTRIPGNVGVSPYTFLHQYLGSAPNEAIDVIEALGKLAADVMALKNK